MSVLCPWPGCPRRIRPAQLACREHWRELPLPLRGRLLREYHKRPGSLAHMSAVREGIRYLRAAAGQVTVRIANDRNDITDGGGSESVG